MKKESNPGNGRRGPAMRTARKKRITICLDNVVLDTFRKKSEEVGDGYQTMINDALRQFLASDNRPVDQRTLRRILREELRKAG
jgi:uncharacterized protein (DUF4415 family)